MVGHAMKTYVPSWFMTAAVLLAATACFSCSDPEATPSTQTAVSSESTLSSEDVAELRRLAEQDASLVLAGDWETMAAQYTEDAVRMPPNAPAIEGRDAIRQSLEGLPPISDFNFEMVDLEGDGQIAYMRAMWSITVAPPDAAEVSDSGKILVVFRKQPDGSWLRVADA